MTSISSILKDEQRAERKPFLLKPVGKDYLWGGNRLNDDFAKNIEMEPLAETWECSTHPDGTNIVASGEFAGMSLKKVLEENPEFTGTHPKMKNGLPILIKLIDAKRDLSVQVHPDDEYAKEHENGQLGKTEMWYVLDAEKDSRLVFGLHHDIDKQGIRQSIRKGNLESYLQKIPVKPDDVFYIKAGTIHAIGAGILVAEIQESSNLTYRLYDYDRLDRSGKKRKLHIEKALDVADLHGITEPVQPMRVLKYRPGCAAELLCRCQYFQVERMLINTERQREMAAYQTSSLSFRVLLCLGGCGTMFFRNEAIHFFKGDCIFIPASSVEIRLHGRAQFLDVGC